MQKHSYWVLFLLVFSCVAQAASWKDNPEFTSSHPCYKDLPKFCGSSTIVPEKHNHYRCLGENYSRLSPSCHQFMTTFWKPFACSADILKLCKGEDQNIGRSIPCISAKKSKLSPNCKTYVDKIEAIGKAREEQYVACDSDRKKFCSDKRGGDIGSCMKQNEAKLSSGCLSKIKKVQELM